MARILKLPTVLDRKGGSRSKTYVEMEQGLFPRPIKLGLRAVGWPEHEVEQVIAARIAGVDDTKLRKLVQRLHEARTALAIEMARSGGR